jgi:hypothetical protein
MKKAYSETQGQYFPFVYHYTRIRRRVPAEVEMHDTFASLRLPCIKSS